MNSPPSNPQCIETSKEYGKDKPQNQQDMPFSAESEHFAVTHLLVIHSALEQAKIVW